MAIKAMARKTPVCHCPICNGPTDYSSFGGPYGTEEWHENCSRCGFYREFVYGYFSAAIQGKEFYWSYSTRRNNPVFRKMRRAEFMARRNWKKRRKTYKIEGL